MPETFPFPPAPPFWQVVGTQFMKLWAAGLPIGLLLVLLFVVLIRQNNRIVRRESIAMWGAVVAMGAMVLEADSIWRYLLMALGVTGVLITSLRLVRTEARFGIASTAGMFLVFAALASSFTPAVASARTAARRSVCRNNLKQIGLALHNFESQHKHFPTLLSQGETPPRSWRVDILPFLDQQPLRNLYVDTEAWDAIPNVSVARQKREWVYSCPSNPRGTDSEGRSYTAYVAPDGDNTFMTRSHARRFGDIVDGTANTVAVVEACGLEIVWTEPRDAPLSSLPVGINRPGSRSGRSEGLLSSYHTGGAQVLMADGAVRFVSQNLDPQVLSALLTVNGNEPVDDDIWR